MIRDIGYALTVRTHELRDIVTRASQDLSTLRPDDQQALLAAVAAHIEVMQAWDTAGELVATHEATPQAAASRFIGDVERILR